MTDAKKGTYIRAMLAIQYRITDATFQMKIRHLYGAIDLNVGCRSSHRLNVAKKAH